MLRNGETASSFLLHDGQKGCDKRTKNEVNATPIFYKFFVKRQLVWYYC